MKGHWLKVIKIVWILAVIAAIAMALHRLWPRLITELGRVDMPQLALACISLLTAKIVLAEIARYAFTGAPVAISRRTSLQMYSISQLGKYIPGNIWHLVGKAAMIVRLGLNKREAAGVVFVENAWLVGSAAAFGSAAALSLPFALMGLDDAPFVWIRWLGASTLIGVGIALLCTITPILVPRFRSQRTRLTKVALLEFMAWVALGLCFFLCLPDPSWELEMIARASGAFALGWLAGYLSPFAPAGVGVRELVIVLILKDLLPIDQITAALVLNRLVWLFVEVGLGAAAAVSSLRSKSGMDPTTVPSNSQR